MSVRPITRGEEFKAIGHPFGGYLSVLGASQGLLTYLHRHRIPFSSNWFAAPGSPGKLIFFVVGGYVIGRAAGDIIFSDSALLRLRARHLEDERHNVESQLVATRGA